MSAQHQLSTHSSSAAGVQSTARNITRPIAHQVISEAKPCSAQHTNTARRPRDTHSKQQAPTQPLLRALAHRKRAARPEQQSPEKVCSATTGQQRRLLSRTSGMVLSNGWLGSCTGAAAQNYARTTNNASKCSHVTFNTGHEASATLLRSKALSHTRSTDVKQHPHRQHQ